MFPFYQILETAAQLIGLFVIMAMVFGFFRSFIPAFMRGLNKSRSVRRGWQPPAAGGYQPTEHGRISSKEMPPIPKGGSAQSTPPKGGTGVVITHRHLCPTCLKEYH